MRPEIKTRLLLWLRDDMDAALEEDAQELAQAFRDLISHVEASE